MVAYTVVLRNKARVLACNPKVAAARIKCLPPRTPLSLSVASSGLRSFTAPS